jgi:periplasmic protein TonB
MTDYSRFDSNSSAAAGLMSLAVHGCVVMLLFTVLSSPAVQVKVKQAGRLFMPVIAAHLPEKTLQGGGGGGDLSPIPASMGRAPKFAARQFVPPAAVTANANPKLLIDPTLIGPPDVQTPNSTMAVWGDPLAKLGPPSNGNGSGGGIGSGDKGGIGPGRGPGFGPGEGGGITEVYVAGGGVSAPALTFQVDPEYSEEARKAKYSGVVVLSIEVDQSGRTRNLRVAKGVGLGLDEKAIEAVRQWRFKPGLKNGKPVIVRAQVEVNFRLL